MITGVFTPEEAAILADLARDIVALLDSHASRPDDPALARLLPDAYRDDAEAAADFRRFTVDGLVERKTENAKVVLESVTQFPAPTTRAPRLPGKRTARVVVELDDRAAGAWMRTITDLRLTLASRLGIVAEDSAPRGADEGLLALYDWLAFVQDSLVRAVDSTR